MTTASDHYAGNLERNRDESYATDVDLETRPESARETVERALAEARSSLEEASTAAERLIEERPAVPAAAEQFDRIEHDREALRVAASHVRARERALVAAWRELEDERRAFEIDRAELIQQALDNGYSLGLAESSPENEVGRRRDWDLTPPGVGDSALALVDELVHIEIVDESDGETTDHAHAGVAESRDFSQATLSGVSDESSIPEIQTGLRVVAAKSIDSIDVTNAMARLRDSWTWGNPNRKRDHSS